MPTSRATPLRFRLLRLLPVTVAVFVVVALVSVSPSSAATIQIDILPIPGTSQAFSPVTTADDHVWFTSGSAQVSDLAPDGTVTNHVAPPGVGQLALGPNSRIWYARISFPNSVGFLTPETDSFVDFPSLVNSPSSLAPGPDGNMWYSSYVQNSIIRVTPAGVQTAFPVTPNSGVLGITAGPDGNIWFSEVTSDRIARMNPTTGSYVEFDVTAGSGPAWIITGPDANMWFSETTANRIGRITPAGIVTEFSAGISPSPGLFILASGADGNVWFVEQGVPGVGRITPDGVVTEFPIDPALGPPTHLAPGPNNTLVFDLGSSGGVLGPGSGVLGIVSGLVDAPPTTTTTTTPPVVQPISAKPAFTG